MALCYCLEAVDAENMALCRHCLREWGWEREGMGGRGGGERGDGRERGWRERGWGDRGWEGVGVGGREGEGCNLTC